MNTTMQFRVDQKTKAKARKAFVSAGLDMSSGMNLYLTHVANTGKVPFEMFTYDNIPEVEKKKIVADMKKTLRDYKSGKIKGYDDVDEMFRDILGK